MIDIPTLEECLSYDPNTGEFHYRLIWWNSHLKPGDRAGSFKKRKGYRQIIFKGRWYQEHRLAWFFVHGRWPVDQLDHVNGDRADNRIANLREATNAQNARNRTTPRNSSTGIKGVHYNKKLEKWVVHAGSGRGKRYVGLYPSLLAAEIARGQASAIFHGKFARA